jgi:hypothetical protein
MLLFGSKTGLKTRLFWGLRVCQGKNPLKNGAFWAILTLSARFCSLKNSQKCAKGWKTKEISHSESAKNDKKCQNCCFFENASPAKEKSHSKMAYFAEFEHIKKRTKNQALFHIYINWGKHLKKHVIFCMSNPKLTLMPFFSQGWKNQWAHAPMVHFFGRARAQKKMDQGSGRP